MIGQTVGKYRVQDRIGRGGMGTVYLAKDETLHREVAIKVLNSELNDPEVARRFRSEAITVARLSHPGIATIYELFEHDGQWLMVMEFVRGETLEHLVQSSGSQPVERAVDLCAQALTALSHAHSMGVIHRDLKPANLMVTASGQLKIMDFGIARVAGAEHLTTAGFMMGTPAYMAPEQVLGHEIDARADLYAMGVVLYRLTTGKLPFKGETPFAMAQSQVNDPPTPVRLMRDGLPGWIEQVIGRALSKSPADRFATADEFRETLRRGLAGLPIELAPNAFVPPDLMMTTPARGIGIDTSPSGMPTTLPASSTGGQRLSSTGPTRMATGNTGATGTGRAVPADDPAMAETVMGTTGANAAAMAETVRTGANPSAMADTVIAGPGGPPLARPTPTAATISMTGKPGATAQAAKLPAKKSSGMGLAAVAAAVVVVGIIGGALWYRSRGATPADAPVPSPAADPNQAAATPVTTPDPTPVVPTPAATVVTSGAGSGSGAQPGSTPRATPGAAERPDPAAGGRGVPGTAPGSTGAGIQPTVTPLATPAGRGAVPEVADAHVAFGKVKMVVVTDNKKARDQDVVINLVAGQISLAPKNGGAAITQMLYKNLKHAIYVHAKDPKFDERLAVPPTGTEFPHGFMGGSRHWLVLQTTTAYVVLALDDSNLNQILDTVETRTGVKVDKPAAGGR